MAHIVAIRRRVEAAVSAAVAQVEPADPTGRTTDPLVRPSERADFQSTAALAVAARTGRPALDIAHDLAGAIRGVSAEVSGPGFLNLTVPDAHLWKQVGRRLADDRLGVGRPLAGQRVVIDYSAPNIAKEMHVGHLRSTVIGDAAARLLDWLGHDVRRMNHVGDWGTPFGMLIEHLLDIGETEAAQELSVGDLTTFYQAARAKFDADPAFADRSRLR